MTVNVPKPTDHSLQETPVLVITDVYPHVVIATLDGVRVPAGGAESVRSAVTMSLLPAGEHNMFVLSSTSTDGVIITIKEPTR